MHAFKIPRYNYFPANTYLEKWLWRYLRGLNDDELAWLSSPAVLVERRYKVLACTDYKNFWGHCWFWKRTHDGHEFASLKLTSFVEGAHSLLWVDDGTEDIVSSDDVDAMVGMWKKAIARNR
jgi:hypothetical protein